MSNNTMEAIMRFLDEELLRENDNKLEPFYDEFFYAKDLLEHLPAVEENLEKMHCSLDVRTLIEAYARMGAMEFPIKLFDAEFWSVVPCPYRYARLPLELSGSCKSDAERFSTISWLCTKIITQEFMRSNRNVYSFTLDSLKELSQMEITDADQKKLKNIPTSIFFIKFDEPVEKYNADDTIARYYGALVEVGTDRADEYKFSLGMLTSCDKTSEDGELVVDNHKTLFLNFAGYYFTDGIKLTKNRVDPKLKGLTSVDKSIMSAILHLCSDKAEISEVSSDNKQSLREFIVK